MFEKSNLFWQKHAPVREQSRFLNSLWGSCYLLGKVLRHILECRIGFQCSDVNITCGALSSIFTLNIYIYIYIKPKHQESPSLNLNFKTLVLLKSQINLSQHPEPWLSTLRSEGILFFCCLFFWLHSMALVILVPGPGIEPSPPALEAQNLNHWSTREVPEGIFLRKTFRCLSL